MYSCVFSPAHLAAKDANQLVADDLKAVIGPLQLPVTGIIVAISVEHSAAMKAGASTQEEK